jgi:hypothetical protein
MAMDGLRALTDAHRGMRMKAAHDKKRGVAAPPPPGPGEGAVAGGPVPGPEDDFMATPEFERLLGELCAQK